MAFDDDDTPTAAPAAAAAETDAPEASEDAPTAEEALEEEAQDFRLFAALFRKKSVSAQTIRKGEKDFESHGTRAQQNALEQSRQAMEDVLSYTRVYKPGNWLRGWYFPDRFADWAADGGEAGLAEEFGGAGGVGDRDADADAGAGAGGSDKRRYLDARDRVVVVEGAGGIVSKTIGRVVTGQAKDRAARDKMWLLPEEALFLVERGSLDLWWPMRGIETVFPLEPKQDGGEVTGEQGSGSADDEYDLGLPLSLEAAYSLLIGNEGERGKVTLQKFQVYSNLKRGGYKILRAPQAVRPARHPQPIQTPSSVWQWLFSLLFAEEEPHHQPYGPLVRPGLYRSYKSIYGQLAIIPRHKPTTEPSCPWPAEEPFRIHFHVWKSGTTFSKTRPPPPDFYLSVVDAQESDFPTLEQMAALLDSSPWAPPKAEWAVPGRLYQRLKHGYRNVILAVVDHGVVNYLRVAETAFGEESLVYRFDYKGGHRGGKRGGELQRLSLHPFSQV
ncbi:tRNA-splicing endonuclease subunit sen54 N-term-domain-containing protein [Phialemonium atrogriseum]|uniref:tRNA-splicing endonuclease subunit sen54 N-term-domain-containing protein n=1 Tax=Phialemonium atrogriseum TaxID=1093897 RepID=A0AAJ0FRV2_9PEZI|nr:tRNA-splicing endonuclease subunit sen54 N-term-domain-containing protein [Phialemonium atrogriseum]KAK1772663.1 tRNA-splicing endonuclease subunit sen54 N-term-domain-containing protein [Phialemonium atrogriseum]